jgi:N-formylglutamate amidohydrolase
MRFHSINNPKQFPVICHIPHGSIRIPKEFRKDFSLSERGLDMEARILADLYAGELFEDLFERFGGLQCGISRIVVDMERFENDKKEPMSKAGMGVLYSKTSEGKTMRKVGSASRSDYLENIYRPYHETLNGLVGYCLEKFGTCLILDCHSFPSEPRPYEADRKKNRPDICIGTDKQHTPALLKKILSSDLKASGYSVKFDSPYSGSIVPAPFYGNKNVYSIMLEVNRKLYMDEKTFKKKAGFDKVSRLISRTAERSCLAFLDQVAGR